MSGCDRVMWGSAGRGGDLRTAVCPWLQLPVGTQKPCSHGPAWCEMYQQLAQTLAGAQVATAQCPAGINEAFSAAGSTQGPTGGCANKAAFPEAETTGSRSGA